MFNSTIFANLRSNLPILIPRSFFSHIKIKLKADLNNEWVNKIDGLATITKKIFVIHRKFCFVLFMLFILIANEIALEKNPVTIESVILSFSVSFSFKNTFSF